MPYNHITATCVMAKGLKSGGRNFVKGQSGNPNGQPKIPVALREIRTANKITIEYILDKYMGITIEELTRLNDCKTTNLEELLIIKSLYQALVKNCARSREYLIERRFGRLLQPVSVEVPSGHAMLLAFLNKKDDE